MDVFLWLPEAQESLRRRYLLLRELNCLGHAGRRVLSDRLQISERTVRNDIASLLSTQVLKKTRGGVSLTEVGTGLLESFPKRYPDVFRIIQWEEELSRALNSRVLIAAGRLPDLSSDPSMVCIRPLSEEGSLSEQELYLLKTKNAAAVAGNVVVSAEGRPLLRLKHLQKASERPMTAVGNNDVSPQGLEAAVRYLSPDRLFLSEKAAKGLLKHLTQRGR